MKKICFVIGVLSNGGSERVVSLLAQNFSKIGYRVSIITLYGDENDYVLDDKVELLPILYKNKSQLLTILGRLILLRRKIKQVSPDVIISFDAMINIYTVISSFFLKAKLVISERNDPNQYPTNKYIRAIRNILYIFTDKIVFQTNDAKKYFSEAIQKKGTIISNPIKNDLPKWVGTSAEKTIITASRLQEQKNLPMLIDAFEVIEREFPEYNLKIFGVGTLKDSLEKRVERKKLSEKIKFPGFSNAIHDEISKATMFVISSNYEGISNSMLEALAIGIPVISTDSPIGGAKMFIKNNENGILISVGATNELIIAMRRIIIEKDLANNLSNNAQKIKSLLTEEKIVKKWIELVDPTEKK